MKNKKVILAAAALVLVAVLMVGVYLAARPETTQGTKTITVTVVHADGSVKDFTCRTQEEYLAPVLVAEQIAQGDETQYGLTIHTVDGEKADWNVNQSYWSLFINGEYAVTGASSTPVNDGDVFRLEYTIG